MEEREYLRWVLTRAKMSSYKYKNSYRGDKTILQPFYLHNGIPYTGETTHLHWIRLLDLHGLVTIPFVSFLAVCPERMLIHMKVMQSINTGTSRSGYLHTISRYNRVHPVSIT